MPQKPKDKEDPVLRRGLLLAAGFAIVFAVFNAGSKEPVGSNQEDLAPPPAPAIAQASPAPFVPPVPTPAPLARDYGTADEKVHSALHTRRSLVVISSTTSSHCGCRSHSRSHW